MLKYEIYRAFFIAFGAVQVITNSIYLIRKDGVNLAKKQHRELPDTATNKHYSAKIFYMLSFGILLFTTGLISSFHHFVYPISFTVVLGVYTLYALIEALYYRFWKTTGAFILPLVLLAAFLLL